MRRSMQFVVGDGLVLIVMWSGALGYAVAELSEGWREVPRHWWSAFPLVGLAVSLAAVIGALSLLTRRDE
ncbi:MAG: hypothetical protein R2823_02085 [Acidimicrobiia bacterium]